MLTFSKNCSKVLAVAIGVSQKSCYHISSITRLSSTIKVETGTQEEETKKISAKSLSHVFLGSSVNTSQIKDCSNFSSNPDVFGTLSVTSKTADDEEEYDDGDIQEREHLENVPDPSQKLKTRQYANMIKEHLRNKNVQEAINVLEERMLKQDRVKPENYIYNLLISGCGKMGQTKQAFQLYNQMKKRSLKVTGGTYTSLFNSCATSFYPKDALKRANHLRQLMVEKNYEPNAANYHAMIKTYGRCGDLSTAFSLVDEMVEKKVTISSDTINFLLHACISEQDAGFRHSLLVWRKMRDHRIKPSDYTYNLILRACKDCGLGNMQLAGDLLQKISKPTGTTKVFMTESLKEGPKEQETNIPNTGTGNEAGIDLVQRHSNLETQKARNETLVPNQSMTVADQDFEEPLPRLVEGEIVNQHASSLSPQGSTDRYWPNLLAAEPHLGCITSISELKLAQDRLLLLGGYTEFLRQMERDGVVPNLKTFTQLLDLIPITRSAEKGLLTALKRYQIKPDISFYNMLIKKRSMRGDYEGSREVLSLIAHAQLKPDIITYGVLALNCKTEKRAIDLLSEVERAGYRVNAEILGALLKQASYHWSFGYVLEMMETAKREEVEINPMFYKHLDTFYRKCRQLLYEKELGRPVAKFVDSEYFVTGFKLFSARYKSWLKETQTEPPDLKRRESV